MSLIEKRRGAYEAARAAMEAAADAVQNADDTADIDALEADFVAAKDTADRAKGALARAEDIERSRQEHPAVEPAPKGAEQHGVMEQTRGRDVRVGEDREITYRADKNESFFADMFRMRHMGDQSAASRLQRHAQEMDVVHRDRGIQLRDVGTSAFDGLTVPQYLIDLYAPLARAGRPYANSVRSLPLPATGMTVEISRITTGTAAAVQASENAAVQETNIDDTKLTVNVRTYAGQQDVSRQALERSEMVDMIVYADLVADYHTKLDSGIINDDGTSGTHLGVRRTSGINAVTYTDASPTVPEAWPKFADALQQVNSNLYLPATAWLMHPRRWGWLTAALDSSNRPLIVPSASVPTNAMGTGLAAEYGQVVGQIMGVPVITDANLPSTLGTGTNEDLILAYRAFEHILWEEGDGMPRRLRFEETNGGNLSVKMVVYGYSAFTAGRQPAATSTVGGTGLVTPSF